MFQKDRAILTVKCSWNVGLRRPRSYCPQCLLCYIRKSRFHPSSPSTSSSNSSYFSYYCIILIFLSLFHFPLPLPLPLHLFLFFQPQSWCYSDLISILHYFKKFHDSIANTSAIKVTEKKHTEWFRCHHCLSFLLILKELLKNFYFPNQRSSPNYIFFREFEQISPRVV